MNVSQVIVAPPPKHLMYAEVDGPYNVDARYMAHVNEGMLTSTIFDPSQFPDAILDRMFRTVFAKGVCLRICDFDHFKRIAVSLFGPRSPPIFSDPARKWPLWFKRAEYTPKALGVTAPKEEPVGGAVQEPPQVVPRGNELVPFKDPESKENGDHDKGKEVEKEMETEQKFDLLGLDKPDPAPIPVPAPAVAPDTAPAAAGTGSSSEDTKDKLAPAVKMPPMPLSYQSDKHNYEMKLLWDFMNSSKKDSVEILSKPVVKAEEKTNAKVGDADKNGHGVKETTIKPEPKDEPAKVDALTDFKDEKKRPTATVADSSAAPAPEAEDNMLIKFDAPASRPVTPASRPVTPAPSRQKQLVTVPQGNSRSAVPRGPSMSKALVRRSTFATGLCHSMGRLMADLPYCRGRIRMQVDLGRVYIMDAHPEGLAFNMPGEEASGWSHNEITTRMDTICVSPESIAFTKALTLFANDMESVLGLNSKLASNDLLGDIGSGPPPAAGDATHNNNNTVRRRGYDWSVPITPDWAFHERRTIYEFKCQRVYMNGSGVIKAQSPFVIEIDGTEPGGFTYGIRSVEDTRPPIWIHCIRRHWDARVSVSYTKTDKLEEEYGQFARDLLRTLVVPPGPIASPRFQFAFDHRETKTNDNQTFSTTVLSARVRNVGRFQSTDKQTFFDISWNWLMALAKRPSREKPSTGTVYASPVADHPARGVFSSWYEASVSSVAAEEAFKENETLPIGGLAAWGVNGIAAREEMYEAAFGPALKLIRKMDGVGVLVDNGQGHQWTPPVKASQVALAVQKFW